MQVKITETREIIGDMTEAHFTFHKLATEQPASNVIVIDNTTGVVLFTYENGNFHYVSGDFMKDYIISPWLKKF